MPDRFLIASDFPPNITLSITPPPNSQEAVNVLILLHGLGDTNASFTDLAKQLCLPNTVCIAVQAPTPVPFDLGGFHWGDDIIFDQRTGQMEYDTGFTKSMKMVGDEVRQNHHPTRHYICFYPFSARPSHHTHKKIPPKPEEKQPKNISSTIPCNSSSPISPTLPHTPSNPSQPDNHPPPPPRPQLPPDPNPPPRLRPRRHPRPRHRPLPPAPPRQHHHNRRAPSHPLQESSSPLFQALRQKHHTRPRLRRLFANAADALREREVERGV